MSKEAVRDFWNQAAAGEFWATGETPAERFRAETSWRYHFEPYIRPFADFASARGRDVLEIGVGMGSDHQQWAEAKPRSLTGIDLSAHSIELTRERFALFGLGSDLRIGDCEQLPFADNSFDIVYSWGVLHHSPDTPQAIREVHRVLRPGGIAKIMIYHKWAMTGYMLWLRYALLAGRPGRGLDFIYAHYLESPGTKAYTVEAARALFAGFSRVDIGVQLNHGDLLQSEVGRRHRGPLLSLAKAIWPRWLIRRLLGRHGLYLMISAVK